MPTTCCIAKCESRGNHDTVNYFKLPSKTAFMHRIDINEVKKKNVIISECENKQ